MSDKKILLSGKSFTAGGAIRRPRSLRATYRAVVLCWIAGLIGLTTHPLCADTGSPALLVRVPLPIGGTVDEQVRRQIDRFLNSNNAGDNRPVLVLEFSTSGDNSGDGSQFERSFALARFLTSHHTKGMRTVAYLPQSLRGHAVLPAIACEEIIMAPNATLGAAGVDEEAIDPTIVSAYQEIANRSRTVPAALVLGMVDADLEVLRAETAQGTHYVLRDDLDALQKDSAVAQIETVIPAGEFGHFSGDELRLEFGFVSRLAVDRSELTRVLDLPARSLRVDAKGASGQWKAIQVKLTGAIDSSAQRRVQRTIDQAVRDLNVDFICLWLDSPGGVPAESLNVANYLADLDSSQIHTVAYIPNEARADAALVAFACDELVMHPDAILGGPGVYQMDAGEIRDVRTALQENLARKKSANWSLIVAMLDPEVAVHEFHLPGAKVSQFFCEDELLQQTDPDRWERGTLEVDRENVYRVDGKRAQQIGLATHVATDFEAFKELFQLEDDPALAEASWSETLVAALASPELAGVLLFVAGFALIVELMSPGIGAGGFVALLCYTLFFWSQHLHGTAGWLEFLLFLLGVSCVAMESFVIPGFGIFGLGGGALVIASLVLASQTFFQIPQNAYQIVQLRNSLLVVLAAAAGLIAALTIFRQYLHQAPILRRLMLLPPAGNQRETQAQNESLVQWDHLTGQHGRTTTRLSPAGKARFGEELVNVISDGELLNAGTNVVIVEVRGNHVVVSKTT